ncbi:unnamed protein product, partial [marine sediment metagenome]
MNKKIHVIFFVFVLVFVCFTGCNESTEQGNDLKFDTTQPEGCPTNEEVDQWQE